MSVDPRLTLGQIERLRSLARMAEQAPATVPAGGRGSARQRRDLGRRLGAELFSPPGADAGLTSAGEAALTWAQQVLDGADELDHELRDLAAGRRGRVDLVVSLMLASYRLPPVLARFSATHPQVSVRMHVADTDRALELVAAGRQDFAIVSIQPRAVDRPLRATRLGQEDVILVAAADTDEPPARVAAGELEHLPFVEADRGVDRRTRELRMAGVTTRRIVARLGHPEAIKAAVRAHLGVAMLPRSAVVDDVAAGTLREIAIDGFDLGVPVCLIQRDDAPAPTPAQERLLGHLVRELRAEIG